MDDELTQRVIGCAFEVSNTLGAGFFEKVYEKALCIELGRTGLDYECQQPVSVSYKDLLVGEYIADIIVEGRLLLELKALSTLGREHEAQLINYLKQLINYLKATGLTVGLLLNFGRPRLGIKRMIWNHDET